MSDPYKTIAGILGGAVINGGTLSVQYPAGTNWSSFGFDGHKFSINNAIKSFDSGDFNLTFGATSITITNATGLAWPADAAYVLQLNFNTEEEVRLLAVSGTINTNAALGLGSFRVEDFGGDVVLANPTNLVRGRTYIWTAVNLNGGDSLTFGNKFLWTDGAPDTSAQEAGTVNIITAYCSGSGKYLHAAALSAFS